MRKTNTHHCLGWQHKRELDELKYESKRNAAHMVSLLHFRCSAQFRRFFRVCIRFLSALTFSLPWSQQRQIERLKAQLTALNVVPEEEPESEVSSALAQAE